MSTRNTIITSMLTALITSICTFFVLQLAMKKKNTPREVLVPQLVGLKPTQAMEVLDGRKLRLQIIERKPDPNVPAGQICKQHPLPESKVLAHSAVNVVLSAGPPQITVPSCESLTIQAYTVLLSKAQLKLGTLSYAPSETMKPGEIVSCTPKTGSVVKAGATVALTVAKKEDAMKEVPKLKGMSCSKAKKAIVEAGFKVGKVKWRTFDAPPYLVMRQKPDPETKAKPGTEVEITCSRDED